MQLVCLAEKTPQLFWSIRKVSKCCYDFSSRFDRTCDSYQANGDGKRVHALEDGPSKGGQADL